MLCYFLAFRLIKNSSEICDHIDRVSKVVADDFYGYLSQKLSSIVVADIVLYLPQLLSSIFVADIVKNHLPQLFELDFVGVKL